MRRARHTLEHKADWGRTVPDTTLFALPINGFPWYDWLTFYYTIEGDEVILRGLLSSIGPEV